MRERIEKKDWQVAIKCLSNIWSTTSGIRKGNTITVEQKSVEQKWMGIWLNHLKYCHNIQHIIKEYKHTTTTLIENLKGCP